MKAQELELKDRYHIYQFSVVASKNNNKRSGEQKNTSKRELTPQFLEGYIQKRLSGEES